MQIIILYHVFGVGNNIISSLRQMCKPFIRSHILILGCVYMEEGLSSLQGQPSLWRFRVSVQFFFKICFRLYERTTSPPCRCLTIDYPRSRLGGLEIFNINALKRASKVKLRIHKKICIGWHFVGKILILQVLFVYVQVIK